MALVVDREVGGMEDKGAEKPDCPDEIWMTSNIITVEKQEINRKRKQSFSHKGDLHPQKVKVEPLSSL